MTEEERIRLLEERVKLITAVRDLRSTLRDMMRELKKHTAHPTFAMLYEMAVASLERNDP